ncbi:MAG: SCP2 sterol-binding domain-containing protein [Oscillospiraceae bacterium]|nr:SCP2 sterol-binding domain-containing protein [Oscillospiraceae bacterium]
MANVKKAVAAETASAAAKPTAKVAEKKTSIPPAVLAAEKKIMPAATEKPAVKKPIAEKPIVKKPVAEKTAEEKPVAEKPVAKKSVKKPVEKNIGYDDVFAVAKSSVKAKKDSVAKISDKIAATFEVMEGGSQRDFYILIESGKASVQKHRYDEADIWIKGAAGKIAEVMEGKVKLTDALSSGDVEIYGKGGESAKYVVLFTEALL